MQSLFVCVYVCVCVSVWVWERERAVQCRLASASILLASSLMPSLSLSHLLSLSLSLFHTVSTSLSFPHVQYSLSFSFLTHSLSLLLPISHSRLQKPSTTPSLVSQSESEEVGDVTAAPSWCREGKLSSGRRAPLKPFGGGKDVAALLWQHLTRWNTAMGQTCRNSLCVLLTL